MAKKKNAEKTYLHVVSGAIFNAAGECIKEGKLLPVGRKVDPKKLTENKGHFLQIKNPA